MFTLTNCPGVFTNVRNLLAALSERQLATACRLDRTNYVRMCRMCPRSTENGRTVSQKFNAVYTETKKNTSYYILYRRIWIDYHYIKWHSTTKITTSRRAKGRKPFCGGQSWFRRGTFVCDWTVWAFKQSLFTQYPSLDHPVRFIEVFINQYWSNECITRVCVHV